MHSQHYVSRATNLRECSALLFDSSLLTDRLHLHMEVWVGGVVVVEVCLDGVLKCHFTFSVKQSGLSERWGLTLSRAVSSKLQC